MLDSVEYFFICLMRYPAMSHTMLAPAAYGSPTYTSSSSASSNTNGGLGSSNSNSSSLGSYTSNSYGSNSYSSVGGISAGRSLSSTYGSNSGGGGGGGMLGSVMGRYDVVNVLHNRGISAWIRTIPYLALLQEYLKEFVPVSPSPSSSFTSTGTGGGISPNPTRGAGATGCSSSGRSSGGAGTPMGAAAVAGGGRGEGGEFGQQGGTPAGGAEANGSGLNYYQQPQQQQQSRTPSNALHMLDQDALRLRYRELFVRLAAEFWIDLSMSVKHEHHKVGVFRKQFVNANAALSSAGKIIVVQGFAVW
jgi:hypothetical protein